MTIHIREATAADYEAICDIYAEIDVLHHQALPHIFVPAEQSRRSPEFLLEIQEDNDAVLFLAENRPTAEIVGLIEVKMRLSSENPLLVPRRTGYIPDFVVRQAWQQKGVGQLLAKRAHTWVTEKGGTEITLVVWEFNQKARQFYEKLGYTTASRKMSRPLSS